MHQENRGHRFTRIAIVSIFVLIVILLTAAFAFGGDEQKTQAAASQQNQPVSGRAPLSPDIDPLPTSNGCDSSHGVAIVQQTDLRGLNIREDHSLDSRIVAAAKEGEPVTVGSRCYTDPADGELWVNVIYNQPRISGWATYHGWVKTGEFGRHYLAPLSALAK
ncbi:hypothetical protein A2368_01625 [Candidatus Collierbacteria bacterium RIFOXYB1_FULL_49_13]|uniref:Uncharacterized protein n=1 Tax=Candidatus Collierbacteria bacterium RIFOXYB1_FULL_49_13 TaxID=1817728 RepID=A0A1F5FFW1_9BACT|nr:MAG: hypothetical protein A2368_01625 [Candidatus Collierbacteria bacterium RIFOXYB1_FULL_49_13]